MFSFSEFLSAFFDMLNNCYEKLDSIYVFSDYPQLSLAWLFLSLYFTNLLWQLFPLTFAENFGDDPDDSDD